MTKVKYDLVVKTGEYTDRAGQSKGKWQKIGVMFEGNDGRNWINLEPWVNLAGLPRGDYGVSVSCFEPNNGGQRGPATDKPRGDRFRDEDEFKNDDIPF